MGFFDSIAHGIQHRFMNQMFGFGGFGYLGGFGGFGCGMSCWDPCWYQPRTPFFFSPTYSMGGMHLYPELMTPFPSLTPTETFNPVSVWDMQSTQQCSNYNGYNWQNIKINPVPMPQFDYKFEPVTIQEKVLEKEQKSPDDVRPETEPKYTSNTEWSSLKNKSWDKLTPSDLKIIYGDYTRDITTPYTGTADDLNAYLEDKGVLKGHGQAFLDAQNEYGISAAVLIGIAMNESGKGTSDLAKNKNNIGGVRIPGSKEFKTYNNVADCIKDIARFLNSGYVNNKTKTLTKLNEINSRYCPVSDPTDNTNINRYWARNVESYTKEAERAKAVNA